MTSPAVVEIDRVRPFLEHSSSCAAFFEPTDTCTCGLAAALTPATDWRDIAHRAAGHIDALLLYATTCPTDSHATEAMGFLIALRKALGDRTVPRVTGQVKPTDPIIPFPDVTPR